MLAVSETSVFRSKSDLSEYTTLDLYQRLNIGNIFFITENRQGKYWMGTDKGLFLFEKDLKTIANSTKTTTFRHCGSTEMNFRKRRTVCFGSVIRKD